MDIFKDAVSLPGISMQYLLLGSVQDDQLLPEKNIHVVCYCVRLWLRVDTSSLGLLSDNMSGLHKIQNFSVLPGLLCLVRLV